MNEERPMDAEADLIERVLAERSQGEDALAGLDPDALARARELRAFLDGCRSAAVEEAPRAAGLAERVLAATTREDLSWRGDLRLVGGYALRSLRNSRALRIAALVLAMHFVGLSVLAFHVLRQANEPFINVDFEKRPVLPFPEDVVEPGGELSVPEAGEEPRVRDLDPAEDRAEDGR